MPKMLLLCLHGWGGSAASFDELRAALRGTDADILTPNLPGFGGEKDPPHAWTNDEYAEWVEKYLKNSQLAARSSQLFIVAHSHGGRIAMKMALRKNVKIDHLFLCAPAGIKHTRHIRRILGLTLAKTGKIFLMIPGLRVFAPLGKKFLYKLVRVHDYEKANDVMRDTMINVSREDFRPLLKNIDIPVDLFWGTDDRMTPYSDALVMEKELPHATLHTYEGIRHAVHKAKATEIAYVIRSRMSDKR